MSAHAALGASGAHRWMVCPGSIALGAGRETSSRYAREGTAAHEVAAKAVLERKHPSEQLGRSIVVEGEEFIVDEEMVEAVALYWSTIEALREEGDLVFIEERVDLSHLADGGLELFGTSDFALYRPSTKTLWVYDYKHGKGHAVEVVGNPQLRYYALGVLSKVQQQHPKMGIKQVIIGVVQPRAPHPAGPVRVDEVDPLDLIEWGTELVSAGQRAMEKDAPLVPGDHCTFCPAAGICPALQQKALAVAQDEFGTDIAPAALDAKQLAVLLPRLDLLEEFIHAARSEAHARAMRGEVVPGYKLVAKRATRRWGDEKALEEFLKKNKVKKSVSHEEPSLRSVAQLEKALGKEGKTLLAPFIISSSSGVNLVPESDPRPAAAVTATDEFDAIDAPRS